MLHDQYAPINAINKMIGRTVNDLYIKLSYKISIQYIIFYFLRIYILYL